MKVFEACLTVIKRRYASFIIYFVLFIVLSVVMTALSVDQFSTDFSKMKPNFTVINRDGPSHLAEGLTAYLSGHGVEIILEDEKSALQDATFYRATDYIVFLPQGFRDSFMSGGNVALEKVNTTDTAKGYYADSLVNQYLNLARLYLSANSGPATSAAYEEELVSVVLNDLSLEAIGQKKQFGESAPVDLGYAINTQMMCYILLVLNILCVTSITIVFRRPDLRMRNLCSPLKLRSLTIQQMLCCGIMCVFSWLLLTIVGFVIYGRGLGGTDWRIIALMLLNTFVISIVALSIAALTGIFTHSPNAQNASANLISLGLCFLGGVFVPLDMLGEGILTVSRLLPTYWNITALEEIIMLTSFNADSLQTIWQAILIQFGFAVALFCVTLVVGKYRNQSERTFSSVRTELEA